MEDRELLRQYAVHRSEAAFSELVSRHINLVYSAALRMVGDPHQAKDVAQTVFIGLARKPTAIRDPGALGAWLYRSAQNAALNVIRSESRRRHRETEAMNLAEINESTPGAWEAIGPHLDEALRQLNPSEMDVVVLRYFEGKSLRETGDVLSLTENAVQKRASRALDKLRGHFSRRGVTASAAVLAMLMARNSAKAAPTGLAPSLATTSIATATAVPVASTLVRFFSITTPARALVAAAAIITVVAAPVTYLQIKINRLTEQLATAEKNTHIEAVQQTKEIQVVRRLQGLVGQFQEPSSTSDDKGPSVLSGVSKGDFSSLVKGVAGLLNSPLFHGLFEVEAKKDVTEEFAPVIKHFNFNAKDRDRFIQLLTDRQMAEGELMMKALTTSPASDARLTVAQAAKALHDTENDPIKTFLNDDDDFAYFKTFVEQENDRKTVNKLSEALANTAEPLTTTQASAMVDLIYTEWKAFNFTAKPKGEDIIAAPDILSAETMSAFALEQQQWDKQITDKASAVLSPAQMAVFQHNLELERQDNKQGMEIVRLVLGGTPPANP